MAPSHGEKYFNIAPILCSMGENSASSRRSSIGSLLALIGISIVLYTESFPPIVFGALGVIVVLGVLTFFSERVRESHLSSVLLSASGIILGIFFFMGGMNDNGPFYEMILGGMAILLGVAGMIHAGWLILRS